MVAVDDEGAVHGTGAQPLASARYRERHEQDPESWWTAVREAIVAVTSNLDGRDVSGLSVASTSGSLTVVDPQGRATTAGNMYDDLRARDLLPLVEDVGDDVWSRSAYRVQIAAGAVADRQWNTVMGTTMVVKGVSRRPIRDPKVSVYLHRAPFGGGWFAGGASNTGARAFQHAGHATERLPATAARMLRPGTVLEPRPGAARHHDDGYRRFSAMVGDRSDAGVPR